jgi:hypothetical protein
MYRARLCDDPSPEELASLYPVPHDHRAYGYGHGLRVEATVSLGRWLVQEIGAGTMADLSCGNGAIAEALPVSTRYMGDLAPGWPIAGPMEETLSQIPQVDLFILGETLEHLADPDTVLRNIRERAKALLLSTPIGETDGGNPEHIWGWDQEVVGEMLTAAGWTCGPRVDLLLPDTYSYQIWACR